MSNAPTSPATIAESAPSLTFVCCVEAGLLEPMTLRMVESLRRHGGRFAGAPLWAITPRYGPALSGQTLKSFADLKIEHHVLPSRGSYDWYNLWNKIASMSYAQAHATTEELAFIDSDIVLTGEPQGLGRGDFAACVHGTKHIGTTGPGDDREEFWAQLCRIAGLEPDDLPWVETHRDKERIRLYFNSGIFSFRRSTQLVETWREICQGILDANVGEAESKSFFIEQASLGLALARCGLEWQALPPGDNFDVASWESNADKAGFAQARVIHYHDAMKPHFWPQFIEMFKEPHPQVYQWLAPLGPIVDASSKPSQLLAKSLKIKRVMQRDRYHAKSRLF